MKVTPLFLILIMTMLCNGQIPESHVRDLKSGRINEDTSFIYRLPWKLGKKVLLIQGWQSKMSHKGELSQDFKMKVNTSIFAARGGVVVDTKSDGESAGVKAGVFSRRDLYSNSTP
jgi:hypothetical protein